jgi:NADPH:quinone reductase-like Zn-dependent oxidoreductase
MTAGETLPSTMRAVAIDRFGGIDTLTVRALPVPQPAPDEVLIRLEAAGIGAWERGEREGHYAEYLGAPSFPYVLGWEGAGTIVAIGEAVRDCRVGDRVYATTFPKRGGSGGGFYAEYATVQAAYVAPIPAGLTPQQAAAMGWDALTALAGVDDTLRIRANETLLIFGASGGVGHMAVQLAKRLGARVLAVASGEDGVALAKRLGADAAVDGRTQDVLAAARAFAPAGLDAALLTAGGTVADRTLEALRPAGRAAYPKGVTPTPNAPLGSIVTAYDGIRGHDAAAKLGRLIASAPFHVHVARAFELDRIGDAHRMLETHFVGKLVLQLSGT